MLKKLITLLSFLCFIYLLGVLTGRYRLFPFGIVNEYLNVHKQSQTGPYSDVSDRIVSKIEGTDNVKVFITLGQSNASNSGELFKTDYDSVFNYYNGKTYQYKDPSLGTTGKGMSVWGLIGRELIVSGYTDKVVFLNIGVGGISLKQVTSGDLYSSFVNSYNELTKIYGKVDGILFHQGERNNENVSGHDGYYKDFVDFTERNEINNISSPLYLCQTSYCNNIIDRELLQIQDSLIKNLNNILRGPNTDLITYFNYRANDNCHLSKKGLEWFSKEFSKKIIESKEE